MMKKVFLMAVIAIMTTVNVQAQNLPKGLRVEVAEAEGDKSEYSIFTYKDDDETFGYYLSLLRSPGFLDPGEVLGVKVQGVRETCIWLGATFGEADATLDNILDLFDKDLGTSVEFKGRTTNGGGHLGEQNISTCVVDKKPLGGKRLKFFFTSGKHETHAYLNKAVVKELRSGMKVDKKLHPKQHR